MLRTQIFNSLLKVYLILTFLFFVSDSFANEVKIKSFSTLMQPMTVPMQRTDNNGNICALVKIIIPSGRASFEGNLIGECDFKMSEYWCYLSPGSKSLKVKIANFEPFMINFPEYIGNGVRAKQIYEVVLSKPDNLVERETFTIDGIVKIKGTLSQKPVVDFIDLKKGIKIYHNYNGRDYEQVLDEKSLFLAKDYSHDLKFKLEDIHLGDSLTIVSAHPWYAPSTVTITQQNLGSVVLNLDFRVVPVECQFLDEITKEPIPGMRIFKDFEDLGWTDSDGKMTVTHEINLKTKLNAYPSGDHPYFSHSDFEIGKGENETLIFYVPRRLVYNYISVKGEVDITDFILSSDNGVSHLKIETIDKHRFWITYPKGFDTKYVDIKIKGYCPARIYGELFTYKNPLKLKKGYTTQIIEYK